MKKNLELLKETQNFLRDLLKAGEVSEAEILFEELKKFFAAVVKSQ